MAPSHANRDGATLADFFQLLRLRKALIFLILGLVVLTTAVVTLFLPKWYVSTLKVRVEKPESDKLFQNSASGGFDPYFLLDQFKILQSAKILHPVIEKLNLNEKLAASYGSAVPLPTDETYRYMLKNMLNVESPRGSSVIELDVYAQDPALARDIANEIGRVYSEDRLNLATAEQREGIAQLRKELEQRERAVSTQRDRVEQIRKDLDISGVDINANTSDMQVDTLRQMEASRIALSVDAIGRKTRYERFKAIPPEERMNLVNSELIQDQNIQNLLQAYLVADQAVSKLKARNVGEAHPDLLAAVENRSKIKEQLDAQLRGYESALEISYKEAEARVSELTTQLKRARGEQIDSARDRMRPFEEAKQKLEDDTRLLSHLKLTLGQREIDFQVPKRQPIEILNTAEEARRPSKPKMFLNVAFALLFGLVLGVGTAVLVEYFDTSFRTVSEIENRLQRPVLGVVPFSAEPMKRPTGEDEDPADLEPFRVLQTNLNLALKTAPKGRSLVMLSAGPGEGKSTTLLRLARAMGLAGERVLLIDSDLRRPTQHQLANRPKEPGLADLLQGKSSLAQVTQKDASPGLDFIPCGSVGGFTLSLLYVDRLKALLAELRDKYDRVVFDAPPIIGVSDASVLASVADDVLLLIQHRRNPQSMVVRAQQIIESLHKTVLGVVLNRVPPNSSEDYGYYTRNYAYYSSHGEERSRKRSSPSSPQGNDTAAKAERIAFAERESRRRD
jgi:succinoglycan biosynthesis transport protein ExoP